MNNFSVLPFLSPISYFLDSLTLSREYLKRLNLYRQRIWTCKVTGKTNFTYEEALVSEQRAAEKVQKFPEECIVPVLRILQYSKSFHLHYCVNYLC